MHQYARILRKSGRSGAINAHRAKRRQIGPATCNTWTTVAFSKTLENSDRDLHVSPEGYCCHQRNEKKRCRSCGWSYAALKRASHSFPSPEWKYADRSKANEANRVNQRSEKPCAHGSPLNWHTGFPGNQAPPSTYGAKAACAVHSKTSCASEQPMEADPWLYLQHTG